jgi:hypothetical protein
MIRARRSWSGRWHNARSFGFRNLKLTASKHLTSLAGVCRGRRLIGKLFAHLGDVFHAELRFQRCNFRLLLRLLFKWLFVCEQGLGQGSGIVRDGMMSRIGERALFDTRTINLALGI